MIRLSKTINKEIKIKICMSDLYILFKYFDIDMF